MHLLSRRKRSRYVTVTSVTISKDIFMMSAQVFFICSSVNLNKDTDQQRGILSLNFKGVEEDFLMMPVNKIIRKKRTVKYYPMMHVDSTGQSHSM